MELVSQRDSIFFWENSLLLFDSFLWCPCGCLKFLDFTLGLEDDFIELKLNPEMDLYIEMVSIVQRISISFLDLLLHVHNLVDFVSGCLSMASGPWEM